MRCDNRRRLSAQRTWEALVSYVVSMPDYKGLRGLLVTKDAHKLYEKYGYEIINDRAMMRSPES